jgi:hypothetical protein
MDTDCVSQAMYPGKTSQEIYAISSTQVVVGKVDLLVPQAKLVPLVAKLVLSAGGGAMCISSTAKHATRCARGMTPKR